MSSLGKWMIFTPLHKLPNNVSNLGKMVVVTGFEWLPKVQKIAQSGHTGRRFKKYSRADFFERKVDVDFYDGLILARNFVMG